MSTTQPERKRDIFQICSKSGQVLQGSTRQRLGRSFIATHFDVICQRSIWLKNIFWQSSIIDNLSKRRLHLGTGDDNRTDEFSEKFQTAFDPLPNFREIMLQFFSEKALFVFIG